MDLPVLPAPAWRESRQTNPAKVAAEWWGAEQMRAYGERCALAERERCARVCEEERVDAEGSGNREDFAYNNAIGHCIDAIRKGAP